MGREGKMESRSEVTRGDRERQGHEERQRDAETGRQRVRQGRQCERDREPKPERERERDGETVRNKDRQAERN